MSYYQNQWCEYVNLNHVMKIWVRSAKNGTGATITVKYVDGTEEDSCYFLDDMTADEYLYDLLTSFQDTEIVTHEEIRCVEEDEESKNFLQVRDEE